MDDNCSNSKSNEHSRRHLLWKEVPKEQWDDWQWQMANRVTTLEQCEQIFNLTDTEREGVVRCNGRFALSITPYFASLAQPDRADCPIRRQAVPTSQELCISSHDMVDPCGEDHDSPVPGLVHRYPDRVLMLVTDTCAVYCRYCTRRRMVSTGDGHYIAEDNLESAYEYIANNKKVRDVLISGGDPLLLPDEKLASILKRLRAIPTVEFIRIGTRVPCTLPQRITPALVEMLRKNGPVWVSIHFTHPREITPEVKRACDALADGGIPLGSQTVLLRGINDKPHIMKKLFHELLKIRVRPYYLYQCDPAMGTSHFRTPVSVGINIMEKLRGHTTGYAVPMFVIDAPGGGGKIPVSPTYLISYAENKVTLRNYQGKGFEYWEQERKVGIRKLEVRAQRRCART